MSGILLISKRKQFTSALPDLPALPRPGLTASFVVGVSCIVRDAILGICSEKVADVGDGRAEDKPRSRCARIGDVCLGALVDETRLMLLEPAVVDGIDIVVGVLVIRAS